MELPILEPCTGRGKSHALDTMDRQSAHDVMGILDAHLSKPLGVPDDETIKSRGQIYAAKASFSA